MSDADATDPVKALREWTALPTADRDEVDIDLETATIMTGDAAALARAALSAAPALLARIEAGEGLLRESRERLWNLGFDHGFCAIDDPAQRKGAEQGREIEGRIDAFLAGKEANRG